MRFKTEERYNAVVLQLKGDVMGGPDGAKLHDQLREMKEAGQLNVVVDLSKVRFMNSSGLGMLIGGLSTMRNAGGDLRLTTPDGKSGWDHAIEAGDQDLLLRLVPT